MALTVSITTPSYGQGSFIADAILSVQEQDYPHMEHWVIDGGSGDETCDILKEMKRAYPDRFHWVSESDDGQSDAINKGFQRTSGDIVAWLNADDMYYPGVISRVVEVFERNPLIDVVYGKGVFLNRDGAFLTEFPHNQPFDAARLLGGDAFILQPTVFWRRSLLDRVGDLNRDLHYSMDFDLWCRMAISGACFHYDDRRFYAAARYYRETKTASGHWRRPLELARVARAYSWRSLPRITKYSVIEALMSTRVMTRLYRPWKRATSGLEMDYWEIPSPPVSGSFSVTFPWYRSVHGIRLRLRRESATAGTVTVGTSADRQTVRLDEREADIFVSHAGDSRLLSVDLQGEPDAFAYRVLRVSVEQGAPDARA